jgi:hypothetical protein
MSSFTNHRLYVTAETGSVAGVRTLHANLSTLREGDRVRRTCINPFGRSAGGDGGRLVFIPGSRFDWGLPPEVVRKGIRFPKQAFPSGPLEPRAEDAVVFSTWLEVVGKSQWRSKIGLAIGLGIERTREEIRT